MIVAILLAIWVFARKSKSIFLGMDIVSRRYPDRRRSAITGYDSNFLLASESCKYKRKLICCDVPYRTGHE